MEDDKNMNEFELEKIKEKALENHIPIIMDDTLEVIAKILIEKKPKRIYTDEFEEKKVKGVNC